MKRIMLLTILNGAIIAQPIVLRAKSKQQQNQVSAQSCKVQEDDQDEKVVLANVANMLQSIGVLSTDPQNPVIAGPAIASFGMSVVNIIVQMFKSVDMRSGDMTQEQLIAWFNSLPEESKVQLAMILLEHVQTIDMPRTINHQ